MSDVPIIIHVLSAGDLFQHVFNAIVTFIGTEFEGLVKITALVGIFMLTVCYIKSRDPRDFLKWVIVFVLFTNVVLIPKTTVEIDDISSQKQYIFDNVPVVLALGANLFTTIGIGLAESYDSLFTMPDDLLYTKTGALFGARLVEAARSFRILDPQLKDEMDHYFRSCVVGDIRLNHKYSVSDMSTSRNIWDLISKKASPLRMTVVNGAFVTCEEASKADSKHSLKKKLDAEIYKNYKVLGINLFGKPKVTEGYEDLFKTHLQSASEYYQCLTDESSNIFLQSMMLNAIPDATKQYQAFTNATAGIINQQFTKSQVQHRFAWEIAGIKALWFLPLLHTVLTILLFGVFPLVLALSTLPGGKRIVLGYLQFFLSLQFWPVLFAILNAGMTIYSKNKFSGEDAFFTLVNLDKIDELHRDISGVSGYMMMLIPFIANGLVSNLGAAFSGLATSMTGHVQSSTMAVAGEAASGSFSIGQTSFYNTNANNFSANKHDSNWTHMHGMHTEQGGSGVLKTITGSGDTVYDVSPGMSRNAVSINASEALNGSFNQAFEESKQAAMNESRNYQTSISNFAHRAVQLSESQGHDLRLGDGVSIGETGQLNQALSTMTNIATDVGKRLGISTEDAMGRMSTIGAGISGGASAGGIVGKIIGLKGEIEAHGRYDRSSTASDRLNEGVDKSISAREAQDFNQAFSYVSQFAQSHHFDDSHSKGASLLNQMGADLRDAETASHNYDASLSKASRIHEAHQYAESRSSQINTDLNQAFPRFVASKVGSEERDALFSHPGDKGSLQKLNTLANDFVAQKRDELIAAYGNDGGRAKIEGMYRQGADEISLHEVEFGNSYAKNSQSLEKGAADLNLGVDMNKVRDMKQDVHHKMEGTQQHIKQDSETLKIMNEAVKGSAELEIKKGKFNAQRRAAFKLREE